MMCLRIVMFDGVCKNYDDDDDDDVLVSVMCDDLS
jgi:hypothetical protein